MSKSRHPASRNNQQQQNKLQSIATKVEYNGPIPPASEMAKYSEILESAPERILSMAEESQRHANMMDVKAIDAQREKLGVDKYSDSSLRWGPFPLLLTLPTWGILVYLPSSAARLLLQLQRHSY
jgi:uncharacterized membrane protein